MRIYGVVSAKHEKQAEAILMDLVHEDILDYFELDGRTDICANAINTEYDTYVDSEGYLTMEDDIVGDLSDLVYSPKGYHTFGFEAEYAE